MELHLTPEQEADLSRMALHAGKQPEQLITEAAHSLVEGQRLYREAVQRAIDQADRGEFIEEEEMNARFEKMIRG